VVCGGVYGDGVLKACGRGGLAQHGAAGFQFQTLRPFSLRQTIAATKTLAGLQRAPALCPPEAPF